MDEDIKRIEEILDIQHDEHMKMRAEFEELKTTISLLVTQVNCMTYLLSPKSQLQGLRDSVDKISEDSPNMIYKSDVLSLLDTLIKREER